MSMSEYSLSDIAAASGESGFGGNNAWWVTILFATTFGWVATASVATAMPASGP